MNLLAADTTLVLRIQPGFSLHAHTGVAPFHIGSADIDKPLVDWYEKSVAGIQS